MAVINQKEYLKKYLNIGTDKDKKKKKKKSKILQNRVKIIDDNIDIINSEVLTANELDEFLTQEDAPQVVGVIDDRPPALRLDDYRKSNKWKLVGSDDEESFKKVGIKSDRNKKYSTDRDPPDKSKKNVSQKHSESDTSPPRRSKHSPDLSPRRSNKVYLSPKRKSRNSDSDVSPIRSNKRRSSNSDPSPPRRRNRSPDSDPSPPRRRLRSPDSDASPPRKRKQSPDSDASPPRRKNKSPDSDTSPHKRNKSLDSDPRLPRKNRSEHDASPVRRKYKDASPTRKPETKSRKSRWGDSSPVYRQSSSSPNRKTDFNSKIRSPERNKDKNFNKHKDLILDSKNSGPSSSKMEKTLDGKTAGLQNARDLKHETIAFKKREEDLFKKMTEEVSGINAAPIIRDRKTGKKRDFEKEAVDEFAKMKKDQEQKDKYNKWGKGLKQVDDLKDKIESDLHEMNKPLARYADDEDLEKYLKEQERDGDPMLAYIRKKKKKNAETEGRPMKPVYEGEFMPNRFGIPPGHRWDGVDRSNGYEKQWFAKENAKKAVEEEIYKWSTEDM